MKLVILDFDGTLADTRGLIVKTMQQTLDVLGLESRTDDQCAAMIGFYTSVAHFVCYRKQIGKSLLQRQTYHSGTLIVCTRF